jgi:hypothetical protein
MKLQELVNQLETLKLKYGPDIEVTFETDDYVIGIKEIEYENDVRYYGEPLIILTADK